MATFLEFVCTRNLFTQLQESFLPHQTFTEEVDTCIKVQSPNPDMVVYKWSHCGFVQYWWKICSYFYHWWKKSFQLNLLLSVLQCCLTCGLRDELRPSIWDMKKWLKLFSADLGWLKQCRKVESSMYPIIYPLILSDVCCYFVRQTCFTNCISVTKTSQQWKNPTSLRGICNIFRKGKNFERKAERI